MWTRLRCRARQSCDQGSRAPQLRGPTRSFLPRVLWGERCATSSSAVLVTTIGDGDPGCHPTLILAPEVKMNRNLYDRLLGEAIHLIVIPGVFSDLEVTPIRSEENTSDLQLLMLISYAVF